MTGVRNAFDEVPDAAPSVAGGLRTEGDGGVSGLESRLREIEALALDERVNAYGEIYDELRRRLELGDEPTPDVRQQD